MMAEHNDCLNDLDLDKLLDAPVERIWDTVNSVKTEIDNVRGKNYNIALDLSKCIIKIGEELTRQHLPNYGTPILQEMWRREGHRMKALGMMAQGDTLWLKGEVQTGWDMLGEAGDLFLMIDDEVGWARTRIGRLFICNDLQRVSEGEKDAIKALEIFFNYREYEKLVRLQINLAAHYDRIKRFRDAITVCDEAEVIIKTKNIQERRDILLAKLMGNRGSCYFFLGDMKQAEHYCQEALKLFTAAGSVYDAFDAHYNIAYNYLRQGRHREALDMLHQIYQDYRKIQKQGDLELLIAYVHKAIGESYLGLNRGIDAITSLRQALDVFKFLGVSSQIAATLTLLGLCEIIRANYKEGLELLEEAEALVDQRETYNMLGLIRLFKAILALHQGQLNDGLSTVKSAYQIFKTTEELNNLAQTLIVWGELYLELGDPNSAIQKAQKALEIATLYDWLPIQFAVHKLLGMANLALHDTSWAEKHFRAAVLTIERLQQHLSLALRSNFLEDKQAPLRELTRLYLAGDIRQAFITLERGKAQIWQNYALNHNVLKWQITDEYGQTLLRELNILRQTRLVSENESLDIDVNVLNTKISQTIEQLNIHCERLVPTPLYDESLLSTIQHKLPDQATLIEYYNDGTHWWVFLVSKTIIDAVLLDVTVYETETIVGHLEAMIFDAINRSKVADDETQKQLLVESREDWKELLREFYDALLAPIIDTIGHSELLIVVPFGHLHNIPFNLLHNGTQYLIENYQLTLIPAATLLLRDYKPHPDGASIIGSTKNHDPYVAVQTDTIASMFDTIPYPMDTPLQVILEQSPRKVLHIAAHSEFDISHPDLSFIELHDKRLYMFDIWQYDVSYELVVLSGCETGRSKVFPGDELIGLGSSFLYKGVQSLIMSLWQVRSDWANDLMQEFYSKLLLGSNSKEFLSKSKALQKAQVMFAQKDVHPLFWGAFQLMGDPRPLY